MRIIAGKHRTRILLAPEGRETTRPITDRVKQSLFDRLSAGGLIEDAVVLDAFCGTGSLGLECVSRGAKHVTFIERDRKVRALLQENLAALKEEKVTSVINCDVLSPMFVHVLPPERYSLIFMDPPYKMLDPGRPREQLFQSITSLADVASDDATVVLRTSKHADVPAIPGWSGPDAHAYGSMVVHLFQRPNRESGEVHDQD